MVGEAKKKIIKTIQSDWVEMSALSIQNACCITHDKIWRDREKTYLDIANKYSDKELSQMSEMLSWLADELEEEFSDALGSIYMECGIGNKYTGQFFTPFHLSVLCARFGIDLNNLPESGRITLNEPSCGGGGMIIAACKVLHYHGFDFQRRLDVVAQDLDWKSVYMTYLQLSLIGCRAVVVQGNTLTEPYSISKTPKAQIMRTPAMMGALI